MSFAQPKKRKRPRPKKIPTGPHGCAACGAEPYTWHAPTCKFRE